MPAAPALFEQLEKNLKTEGPDLVKRIKVWMGKGCSSGGHSGSQHVPTC